MRILHKYWGSPGPRPMEVSTRPAGEPSLPPPPPPPSANAPEEPTGLSAQDQKLPPGYAAAPPVQRNHRHAPYPPASPLPSMPVRPEEAAAVDANKAPHGAFSAPPGALPTHAPVEGTGQPPSAKAPSSGMPLSEKLESKRELLKGTATLPFRRRVESHPEGPPGTTDTGDPGHPHRANIADDDREELMSASPGLGRLE